MGHTSLFSDHLEEIGISAVGRHTHFPEQFILPPLHFQHPLSPHLRSRLYLKNWFDLRLRHSSCGCSSSGSAGRRRGNGRVGRANAKRDLIIYFQSLDPMLLLDNTRLVG